MGHKHISDEEIANLCETNGCEFLGRRICKKRTRIEYRCKCGDVVEADLSNYRRYPNCKKCGNVKVAGENCYRWIADRNEVAQRKRYRKACGQILRRALNGQAKDDHTYALLNYTAGELRSHIQNHPDYLGEDGMQIDHIFPIHAFVEHQIDDLKLVNALSNLRPTYGKDNQSKGSKYDREEFKTWLKNGEIPC